ncbi:MAG: hypothetical protein GTN99_06290 [Candidatus Dadabacteria bacterium]|nr:hypothetical protein [Candidatus Dadabacteria bacterium]NIT13844.1 hypothetical protein [Candidatus Dadabacteria bacterium]
MRHFIAIILLSIIFLGCVQSDSESFVELDGPILESVNSDGNLEFNGVVVNSGDAVVESVFVVIILKDESGNVIEANSTPLFEDGNDQLLYPDQRVFFTLTLNSNPDRVFSKEVEIYYDESGTTNIDVDKDPVDDPESDSMN